MTDADRRLQETIRLLADLVAFESLPRRANLAIAGYVRDYLAGHGITAHLLPGPEGDRFNLFASIGPGYQPGYVLSGHMDVVPVGGQDWSSDPFRLVETEGRLQARGAVDMKGFLACVLAMVPVFKAEKLTRPVHLAFSYDEEVGCCGVPHLLTELPRLCAPPLACIVGEPTELRPVLAHKGKQAMEIVFTGRSSHSSTPDRGENAIYPAAELLLFIRALNARLEREGPFDPRFDPPSSTVVAGIVQGGSAVNIIPDRCTLAFEVRSVPGAAPQEVSALVLAHLKTLLAQAAAEGRPLRASHREIARYPALAPSEDRDLVGLLEALSGRESQASVSYGTEGGLFQAAGIPTIVCGPGSISRAHRPDEYILPGELADCLAMLKRLAGAMSR